MVKKIFLERGWVGGNQRTQWKSENRLQYKITKDRRCPNVETAKHFGPVQIFYILMHIFTTTVIILIILEYGAITLRHYSYRH